MCWHMMHTYMTCGCTVSHDLEQCPEAKKNGVNCDRTTWGKLDMGYAVGRCPACYLKTPPDTPTR